MRFVCASDLQERNILLDLDDTAALEAFEEAERTTPVPRKLAGDRVIYLSREITTDPSNYGRPMLCDFGEARFGSTTHMYTDVIQPYQYRAPEVVLGAPWDEKVDIWTVGVMVRDDSCVFSRLVVCSRGFVRRSGTCSRAGTCSRRLGAQRRRPMMCTTWRIWSRCSVLRQLTS